jgi:hypothetical protein
MRLNYAAIIISAIVYWLLGALWFGNLFTTPWMTLEGMTVQQAMKISPTVPYIIVFICDIIMAYILANVCLWRQVDTAWKGASLGVLFWIGFVATTSLATYEFEGRPFHLFLINYGYCLVGMVIMGIILGAWKKKAA